jgi:hypothetical protein
MFRRPPAAAETWDGFGTGTGIRDRARDRDRVDRDSYRNGNPTGTATGDEAETMYEVVASTVYNDLCCNSFGNVKTSGVAEDPGAMEAICFGNCSYFGSGGGSGPWILADLEAGTYPSNISDDPSNTPIDAPAFATLMLKGFSGDRFALKTGDAQSGPLVTKWDGPRPEGYTPMQKQGALGLGAGGKGSHESTGLFFEGAVTIGCSDDDSVDDAIHANIVAAGYGL